MMTRISCLIFLSIFLLFSCNKPNSGPEEIIKADDGKPQPPKEPISEAQREAARASLANLEKKYGNIAKVQEAITAAEATLDELYNVSTKKELDQKMEGFRKQFAIITGATETTGEAKSLEREIDNIQNISNVPDDVSKAISAMARKIRKIAENHGADFKSSEDLAKVAQLYKSTAIFHKLLCREMALSILPLIKDNAREKIGQEFDQVLQDFEEPLISLRGKIIRDWLEFNEKALDKMQVEEKIING